MSHGEYKLLTCVSLLAACLLLMHGCERRAADEHELMLMMSRAYFISRDEPLAPRTDEQLIREIERFDAVHHYSPAHKMTMLACAAHTKRKGVVKYLLEQGADPNPTEGARPIVSAVPDRVIVDLLLEYGADINGAGASGTTFLHRLVQEHPAGVEKWIQEALAQGADPTSRRQSGETPRDLAVKLNLAQVAEILESAEASWTEQK